MLIVWHLCSVPSLVQISVIVTEIDVYLMTSRELTSGFNFWLRGHLRMAVMHLHIKYGTDIFIQSGVIDIFPKFKMAAGEPWDHPRRHTRGAYSL